MWIFSQRMVHTTFKFSIMSEYFTLNYLLIFFFYSSFPEPRRSELLLNMKRQEEKEPPSRGEGEEITLININIMLGRVGLSTWIRWWCDTLLIFDDFTKDPDRVWVNFDFQLKSNKPLYDRNIIITFIYSFHI